MSVVTTETAEDIAADTSAEAGPTRYPLLTRMAAEAAGTFILMFIGLGALLYSGTLREVDPLINALGFGVAFAAAIALFRQVSGGHINPAISLGASIRGQLRWADLPAYWLAQIAGGVAASAVLFLTLPAGLATQLQTTDQALFTQASNTYGGQSYLAQISGGAMSFGLGQVLVLEAIAAAILTAVVLSKGASRYAIPVVAGLTLTGLILALEPVSGGSANPARSTAAAIFAETAALGQLWLFWLGPLIGGAVAGLAFLMFTPPAPVADWEDDWADDEAPVDEAGATALFGEDSSEAEEPVDLTDIEDAEAEEATEATDAAALPDADQAEAATIAFDPEEAEPVAQVGEEDDDEADDGGPSTEPRG